MGLKYLTLLIGQELKLLSVKLTFLHDESSCLKRFQCIVGINVRKKNI